jgi:hypothetical protein
MINTPHNEHSYKVSNTSLSGSEIKYFIRVLRSTSVFLKQVPEIAPEHCPGFTTVLDVITKFFYRSTKRWEPFPLTALHCQKNRIHVDKM